MLELNVGWRGSRSLFLSNPPVRGFFHRDNLELQRPHQLLSARARFSAQASTGIRYSSGRLRPRASSLRLFESPSLDESTCRSDTGTLNSVSHLHVRPINQGGPSKVYPEPQSTPFSSCTWWYRLLHQCGLDTLSRRRVQPTSALGDSSNSASTRCRALPHRIFHHCLPSSSPPLITEPPSSTTTQPPSSL